MTMFDVAVIAVLAVSGVLAFARGFVHEVLSIAGWVGAFFAAMYGTPLLKPLMLQVINDEFFASLALGAIIFISTLIILSMLTKSISRRVKDSALGALDRSLGVLFGFLRGAIIVCLAYIALEWVIPADEQGPWVREAKAIQMVEIGAGALKALAPKSDETAADKKKTEQTTRDKVQQMFKDAITPKAETPAGKNGDGYDTKERKELDRLFETSK
ncbi:MAG: CvpA family protein [Rhodospirillaceae bacterium]|nr:CvpA family protein [Rhodospirillaceae bacterium]